MTEILNKNRLIEAEKIINENIVKNIFTDVDNEKLKCVLRIIAIIKGYDVNDLQKLCPYSCKYILNDFESSLLNVENLKSDKNLEIDNFLFCLVYFLREIYLDANRKNITKGGIYGLSNVSITNGYITQLLSKREIFDEYNWFRIDYLNGLIYIDLLNFYLGDKSFQAFINYENIVQKASDETFKIDGKIIQLNEDFENKKKDVERLEAILDEQKKGFNFVGISDGFRQLSSEKQTSKKWIFGFLLVIGLLILSVPIFNIVVHFFASQTNKWSDISWQQALTNVGLELLLIYFFRVALYQYRAVQSQIMQLELRKSLCQFIQNYAEYAKEIKENDGVVLDKFENLIFSSIVASDDKIPTTFDGMEQIAKLAEIFKK